MLAGDSITLASGEPKGSSSPVNGPEALGRISSNYIWMLPAYRY